MVASGWETGRETEVALSVSSVLSGRVGVIGVTAAVLVSRGMTEGKTGID